MRKNVEWNHNSIKKEIAQFIQKKFMKDNLENLTYEYPLLMKGIVDSLSMMTIILFLEKQFGLNFYTIDVKREDFECVNTICDLVYSNLKIER
jgi:acyl carrier protein